MTKDPLQPLDDPWHVPDDYPVFTDPTPLPPVPTPPPGRMMCPHCETVFRATPGKATPGEFAVCGHCGSTLIFQDNGHPRVVTYDEALQAESDPRHRLMLMSFGPPLPPE